jgi:hypothetical protein
VVHFYSATTEIYQRLTGTLLLRRSQLISSQIKIDNGLEVERFLKIETKMNGHLSRFIVSASEFDKLNWITQELGAQAVIYPNYTVKNHLSVAIKLLSGDIPTETKYTHLGWRKENGKLIFLQSEGAIGASGFISNINVETEGTRLKDYALGEPPTGNGLMEAVKASLSLLKLAPEKIMTPLLSALFRAPLAEFLPVDFSIFIVGPTGSQKSEVTAIVLSHFGKNFNGKNLPANWTSTANSLEKESFLAKDVLLVIDDYAPYGSTYEVSSYHKTAERVFRAQGNRSGRGRMQSNGSLKADYYSRCLIVSSGEDVPTGQSVQARMEIIEIEKGNVDLKLLTLAQKQAFDGVYVNTMSAYIKYLAGQQESLAGKLQERFLELREEIRGSSKFSHDRTPDITANLILGFEMFLDFAVTVKAIDVWDRSDYLEQATKIMLKTAKSQSRFQSYEDPVDRFQELLHTGIACGKAHVASTSTGEAPVNSLVWGWVEKTIGAGMYQRTDYKPQGNLIGWVDENEELYIEPNAAFATVQKLAKAQGTSISISQKTLWKRLAEKGFILTKENTQGRSACRKTIAGKRLRVIHLLLDPLGETKTGK